jgi:ATP-dependent helicase/nuclease subunit B
MSYPELIFLNRKEPLLQQAVKHFVGEYSGSYLDLSRTVVVMPTKESIRRLNEALVRELDSQGSSLIPPNWRLPMQLPEEGLPKAAPSAVEQLCWVRVLSSMSTEVKKQFFPRIEPEMDTARCIELGNAIRKLRGELAQACLSLSEAREKLIEQGRADRRWNALVTLEENYLQEVELSGLVDRIANQLQGIASPRLPEGTTRLVIACVPDLPHAYDSLVNTIRNNSPEIRIEILIHDPSEAGEKAFDSLGRPAISWESTQIEIPGAAIHLALDRSEEAEIAVRLARASGGSGSSCAIAVASVEMSPTILDELESEGIAAYDPAGKPLDQLSVGTLLSLLLKMVQAQDFRSALQVIHHPHIRKWIDISSTKDLPKLDRLQKQLIPYSLGDLLTRWPESSAEESPSLREKLSKLLELATSLGGASGTDCLLGILSDIYAAIDLTEINAGRESAEQIRNWLLEVTPYGAITPSKELLSMLLDHLKGTTWAPPKHDDCVEIPGWLELLWEDAPHLIVTGMNDGQVPEMRRGDPFMSEDLRHQLHLQSDATRLRRDSYMITSILAVRSGDHGRTDLLLARSDAQGSTLKPSRLLLRCEDDQSLLERLKFLFRELPQRPGHRWTSPWALRPGVVSPPKELSASALKDYLRCPTRFYLKHQLGMRAGQYDLQEADAGTFGELLHETLRAYGEDPTFRDLKSQDQIEEALLRLWDRTFESHYGKNPSFPLLYQHAIGARRIRYAAGVQAKARAEDWEIIACEKQFKNFAFGGMFFTGRIDRIDRKKTPSGYAWRIIDYKSGSKGTFPDPEHYHAVSKKESSLELAPYECFEIEGKKQRWSDLQLPLYRRFFLSEMEQGSSEPLGIEKLESGSVECAYFLMPQDLASSDLVPFEGFEGWEEKADACILGVTRSIQESTFWPPRDPEVSKYDDFGRIFLGHHTDIPCEGQPTLDEEPLGRKLEGAA